MAWKRSRAAYGRARKRYSGFRTKGYGRARSAYKSGGGSIIWGLGGVAAGYLAPRVIPYQDLIVTAIAVVPGILPRSMHKMVPWQLKKAAAGYVVGSMIRLVLPNVLGATAATGGNVI